MGSDAHFRSGAAMAGHSTSPLLHNQLKTILRGVREASNKDSYMPFWNSTAKVASSEQLLFFAGFRGRQRG